MSPCPNRSLEPDPDLPFSRPLLADDVPADGMDTSIEATVDECAAVARETGLTTVVALAAHYRIARLAGGRLRVTGEVRAGITQICVVSLEPFDSEVTQPVEILFAPAATPLPKRAARLAGDHKTSRRRSEAREPPPPPAATTAEGEADPPDPIVDGRIDLGLIAVEFLTLALDFYPRKPGVAFSDVVGETDEAKPSPFAALERFKDRS